MSHPPGPTLTLGKMGTVVFVESGPRSAARRPQPTTVGEDARRRDRTAIGEKHRYPLGTVTNTPKKHISFSVPQPGEIGSLRLVVS